MEFGYWNNTPLSAAKYYGGVKLKGHQFLIVGADNDLVRADFVAIYKRVGRAKFLEVIADNYQTSPTELKEIFKQIK